MNDPDFKTVVETMKDLWPRTMTFLSDEQRNVFWMACGQHTAAQCISVLRDHAVRSPYAAKPADLWKRLRDQEEAQKTGASGDKQRLRRRADLKAEEEQMSRHAEAARHELCALEPSAFQNCKQQVVDAMVTLRGFIAPPGDRHAAQERTMMIDTTFSQLSDDPHRWSDFVVLTVRSAILEEARD